MALNLLPSNIPLHCNICPKKPDFSDVSHLLTHIASKGHLSTYYKVKVRSATEEECRRLIEGYDIWYARWNIEDLMSVRLNLKEKRKSRRRTSAVPGTSDFVNICMKFWKYPWKPLTRHRIAGHLLQPVVPATPTFPKSLHLYNHPVDPRLAQHSIKTEAISRSVTPLNVPFVDPSHLHTYSYAPPMLMWPASPYLTMVSKHEDVEDLSSEASFAQPRRASRNRVNDSASLLDGEAGAGADDGPLQDSPVGGPDKLKGIFWPGMDMFDSAPPEQRRRRNQKKATSVVQQLEAVSQDIEPTELIFTADGEFRKERPITGQPDPEASPISGEESPPKSKKAKRAPRKKALAEKEPNTAGRTSRKRQRRKAERDNTNSRAIRTAAEEDDGLTYRVQKSKRKKGLAVYRDEEVSFDHPADMNYLTSEFHHPAQLLGEEIDAADQTTGSNDPIYTTQQTYYPYQPSFHLNPLAYDHPVLPSWSYLGYDTNGLGGPANALFSGTSQPDVQDDDATISVVSSQQ
ncbi:hypothetical protein MBLNU459_g8210t1 [Dothideomycetes sp. NU459]